MDFYSRASQGFFFKNILSSPVFIENELDDFSEIFMVHFSGIINSNDDFFYSSSFYIYESLFSGKAPSNISYRPKPFIIFNILLFIFFFIFFAYFIVFFPSSTNSFYLSNSNFSNGSSINFIQYTFINFSAYSTILVHFFMFNKISSYVIFMSFFSVFFLIFFTFIFNYKDESFYLDSYDLFFYVSIFLMVFNFIYISFSINLLVVYIGVEFFSIIMYMLIGLYSGNEIISSSRRAELGIKYLMASFLGSVTILVGLSFIYLSYSDFNMSKYYYLYIALPYEYSVFGSAPKVSIIIFIIGLSIKVGLAPFHS
jgi:NADH:ubiquinone oxidoreductase subunit 2 (subunit N)